MKKKIFIVISIFISLFIIVSELKPIDLLENPFEIYPKSNIEFNSEILKFNGKSSYIYAFLNDGTSKDGKDEFVITTVDIKGLLKNQHIIHTYRTVPDNELINPKYENVVDIPESEIKSGSRYYGSIYTGIVPSDCINVEINSISAHIEPLNFNLNGVDVSFKLYYLFVEENSPQDNLSIICTDVRGEKHKIM